VNTFFELAALFI